MFSALSEKVEQLEKENENLKTRLLEMDTRFAAIDARLLEHENHIYPKCNLCKALVYPTDPTINFGSIKLHIKCAKCQYCKCSIDQSNYGMIYSGTSIFCKPHKPHYRYLTCD